MTSDASGTMDLRAAFQGCIDIAAKACQRWNVSLFVPESADLDQAAGLVKDAIREAAKSLSSFDTTKVLPSDYPGLVGGLPGLSVDALASDIDNRVPGSPGDIWGLVAQVRSGAFSFDVPIVYGIEQDAAERIVEVLRGRESDIIMIDRVVETLGSEVVSVGFVAGNWKDLKDHSAQSDLPFIPAMNFRRSEIWDMFRAELAQIPAQNMPLFGEDDFRQRYMKSIRHDASFMDGFITMLLDLVSTDPEPFSQEWQSWFPPVIEILFAVGRPNPMSGMSVILSFSVEEPVEQGLQDLGLEAWEPVAIRNLVVACGLDPIGAYQLLDVVRLDPGAFYDLPDENLKRFRLLGASAIQDVQLAEKRVSSTGRTDVYNEMIAGAARAAAEAGID